MLGLALLVTVLAPASEAAAVDHQVAACEQDCSLRPGVPETDRASCKLQCGSLRRAYQIRAEGIRHELAGAPPTTSPPAVHAPAPTPGGPYTTIVQNTKSIGEIAACQLGCEQAGLADTDRATCKLNCAAQTRIVHVLPAGAGSATAPSASASAPSPVAAAGGASACQASCAGKAGSDAATCRLNCESTYASAPAGPTVGLAPGPGSLLVHRAPAPAADTAACERECDVRADLSPTDRTTCKLRCTRHTTVVVEQWTSGWSMGPPECATGCACASRCSTHQSTCASACAGKSGGDAATCRLQCEAAFMSCRDACAAGTCGCGGS